MFSFIARVLVLVSVTASTPSSYCKYQHCFQVNNSASTGPGSLLEALQSADQYKSSIEIILEDGTFQLSRKRSFQDWDNFLLKGHGFNMTIINCTGQNTGFFFNSSMNLNFGNISIIGCGLEFFSTNIDINNQSSFLKSRTAMYFNSCSNLSFEDFKIENSNGFGITIYNTGGNNWFRHCQFWNNFMRDELYSGGGGFVLETSYCYPGDLNCQTNSTVKETKGALYVLENCEFSDNRARIHHNLSIKSFPHGRSHMELGSGGGLAITFKGRAINNQVVIKSCNFNGNQAGWGGGFQLAFGDTSSNNTITINKSSFSNNIVLVGAKGAGGAVRAVFVSIPHSETWNGYISNVTNNHVSFIDTNFKDNYGYWGGGLSLSSTRSLYEKKNSNTLKFERCSFTGNKARLVGSAIHLSSWKPDVIEKQKYYIMPAFEDCHFSGNDFENESNSGFGALYIQELPTKFIGSNTFYNNNETALVVSNAYIILSDSSVMTFSENHGRRGGALAFIGDSWMTVKENTTVHFTNNSVRVYGLGGAVYSAHFNGHDLSYREDCFFRYHDFTVSSSEWNATFLFMDNYAGKYRNSIYTTSLLPCHFYSSDSKENVEDNIFCFNDTWLFKGDNRNCSNEITTGPNKLKMPSNITVYPGWNSNLKIAAYNDYNQPILTLLIASSISEDIAVSKATRYTSDGNIVIYGIENTTDNKLLVMTPDPRVVTETITVHVLNCPVGFQGDKCENNDTAIMGLTCGCICVNVSGIKCNNRTNQAYLEQFWCATESLGDSNTLAIAKCPFNSKRKFPLQKNILLSDLSTVTCNESKRNGFLCSNCLDGYGVSFNAFDYKCVKCNISKPLGWLFFFLIEVFPITLACFLIVLFKINLASPSMNAFVFFSQVILYDYYYNENRYYGTDYFNPSLSKIILFLYGIWNLQFFNGLGECCLDKSFSTLQIVLIKYLNAFYPMLVLLFCFICIKIYDRNHRVLRPIWKPFSLCVKFVRPNMESSSSIINAFTTLLILSYSKVLQLSYPLIAPVTIYSLSPNGTVTKVPTLHYYFQPSEAMISGKFFYFMFGAAGLIVIIGFPPVFLILYSNSFVQACIGKLNTRLRIAIRTFADSFFAGFKDGTNGSLDCRWISAVYLLFRIIVFVANIPVIDLITRHLIQTFLYNVAIILFAVARPYKKNLYNYIDISIFTILNMIMSLSLCNNWYGSQHDHPQKVIFYLGYILTFMPLFYPFCLITFKLLKKVFHKVSIPTILNADKRSHGKTEKTFSSEIQLPYEDSEELPHRLLHPDKYKPLCPLSSMDTDRKKNTSSRGKKKKGSQREKPENRRLTENYGSICPNNGAAVLLSHE